MMLEDCGHWFSVLSILQNIPEGLLKCIFLDPTPQASDSGGLGWAWRICISGKFQGYADVMGWVNTL